MRFSKFATDGKSYHARRARNAGRLRFYGKRGEKYIPVAML
jgi:hypothetical protein